MSTAPVHLSGRPLWWATALVVVGVVCGTLTLLDMVQVGPWLAVATWMVLALAAVTVTVRRSNRSPFAASVWGLAVAVLLLLVVYSGKGTGPTLPLPTTSTLERLAALVSDGVTGVATGKAPVAPGRGIELLIVTGAVTTFLATELLAIGLRRAGLSGVALLALWSPALLFERILPFGVLLLGGVAYLLLLAVTRPQVGDRRTDPRTDGVRALGAAAAVTVMAVAIGPIAVSAPLFGAMRLPNTFGPGGIDGPLRLSTDLDMRASLAERSDRPVLTYTTDATDLGPLRMFTMEQFDGAEWAPGPDSAELGDADGVLWPTDDLQVDPAESAQVAVQVGDLDEERLPIPLEPRSVEAAGGWLYDSTRDEVVAGGSSTRDLSYVVTVNPRVLTPDVLRADSTGALDADSPYLEVPQTEFAGEIAGLAAELTAGATNTYDQALALQGYFRSLENFRYNTQVPPAVTEDAVWDFLTQRTGYCVQFATAMTVMARTLGIPARLGVGFLPGRMSKEVSGQYVVTGRQAHAWPELYFAEAGWVRFEPTPATQTGAPPVYADPYAGQAATGPEASASAAAQSPRAAATAGAGAGGDSRAVGIGSATVPLVLVVGVLALLAVLATIGVMVWIGRVRRHHAAIPVGPDAWWTELRRRLTAHGVSWSDATTARQAAALLGEHYDGLIRRPGGPTDLEAARRAVAHLVAAVESERYSPTPGAWPTAELRAWVDAAEEPFTRAEESTHAPLVGAHH